MKSYPANGGYSEGMSIHDTYHCWAASQYRQKVCTDNSIPTIMHILMFHAQLDAELAGNSWTPSAPTEDARPLSNSASPPGRPSSAQGLRKSRASARSSNGRPERSGSGSPASFGANSPALSSPALNANGSFNQKAANESYFQTLGQSNADRPADLPPSQGGRYQGFGNTPSLSEHPSYGLS